MALTPSRGIPVGAYYMLIAKRDNNGYPVGLVPDPETISNGTTMQPYLIRSLVNFTPEDRAIGVIANKGGQRVISKTLVGTDDVGDATFTLSEYDETFLALIKQVTVDVTTIDGLAQTASNANQDEFPRFFVLFGTRFTDSRDGMDYWLTDVYGNAQIYQPSGRTISQDTGVNPNPLTFTLTPSLSTKHIDGRNFSESSGLMVKSASDMRVTIRSRRPLAFTSHKALAADTSYALGYRPIYDTASGATNNSFTKNGATFPATALNTSTGILTFTAGADGDFHVGLYQTAFVPA
ncbi:MAG: hypothetical protein KJ043_07585 [Anaerolineae bacterium]|nr:hypothetical protein [Anaerolineae bacterium]